MPLLVPFPDLPSYVEAPRTATEERREAKAKKRSRRQHDQFLSKSARVSKPFSKPFSKPEGGGDARPARSSAPAPATVATKTTRVAHASAPLPLPPTHIRRTPSELRLEALTLYAEHEDVRMYARLLGGMQHRILQAGGGTGVEDEASVHPLSRKSMRNIARTKMADDRELERVTEGSERESPADEDGGGARGAGEDSGWELSYACVPEEDEGPSRSSNQELEDALSDLNKDGDEEDEFVFSMEL